MKQKVIDKVLSVIQELDGKQKQYLEEYIGKAPVWLLESFKVVNMEENTIFIRENQEVEYVYILVKGVVKAIDYRIFGISYDYMWLSAVNTFGSMEVLLELDKYKTTLVTASPCKMLVVSRNKFEYWMKSDINALALESKMMVAYLLEQARRERIFLFMQGTDRVAYLLMQLYKENATESNKVCAFRLTRQELSDCSGLSVKTINRAIAKLVEKGYIGRDGNKLVVNEQQYLKMEKFIAQKIDQ